MMMNRLPYLLFLLFLSSCSQQKEEFPRVWATFDFPGDYDAHFKNLAGHHVQGVANDHSPQSIIVRDASAKLLDAARKHNLKLGIVIDEITEKAYAIESKEVERAVMIAGAYQGKAIDRNRFAFTPEKHEIIIERPIYDKTDCYGELGHYFPNVRDPVKAEIIVKEKDFDGQQHLNIIPAKVGEKTDDNHWKIRFDLSGVTGNLNQVQVAVYWISEGSRDYWIFGDAASPAAQSTKEALRKHVSEVINDWKSVNKGTFPEEIEMVRFGDECWHVSGHMNSPACSYPMWDYSAATVKTYENQTSLAYPRGKTFTDMYGREAYALWMHNYHSLMAGLIDVVRESFAGKGIHDIKLYRNMTRYNTYHPLNDMDGTGLDMLSEKFDILHLDPYPINARGYNENKIPQDMAYVAGLASRHDKLLMPWLQAHQYWPEKGGLSHPKPDHVEKMIRQHRVYEPEAIMWLGYGEAPFSSFPDESPQAWKKAGEMHRQFIQEPVEEYHTELAVIRPYNVRALRDADGKFINDAFFTDIILSQLSIHHPEKSFAPFEPLNLRQLKAEAFDSYRMILACSGTLSTGELEWASQLDIPVILFIAEAETNTIDGRLTGIQEYTRTLTAVEGVIQNQDYNLEEVDVYALDNTVAIIYRIHEHPIAWKKGNITFVSFAETEDSQVFELIYKLL